MLYLAFLPEIPEKDKIKYNITSSYYHPYRFIDLKDYFILDDFSNMVFAADEDEDAPDISEDELKLLRQVAPRKNPVLMLCHLYPATTQIE